MTRKCSNWLQSFAEYTEISEAPPAFHFWTGVSAIAGAIRRRVWNDQKKFKWHANFYIILVAPPGIVSKSTTLNLGHALLHKIPGVKFGPNSMTWQGLLKAFDSATVGVVNPQSGEKPNDVMAKRDIMSCLTCSIGELGTFLRPSDTELTDFLTDMWDSKDGKWSRELSSRDGIAIENPWLNIMGCTTPSWLRTNFTSEMIHGGLTSRCIFVWGEKKTKLIAYPGDVIEDTKFKKLQDNLIHDLTEISQMYGEMKLSKEAKIWGRDWYEKHWDNRPAHLSNEQFGGYYARKQTHIHKLAMVLCAAQSNELVLQKDALELADLTMTSMERDLAIVMNMVSDNTNAKNVDEIVSIIRRNKTITRQTLWRHCIRGMNEIEFTSAIQSAIDAGYINLRIVNNKPQFSIKKDVEESST